MTQSHASTSPATTPRLIVGLEVHVQLRTNSKLFCGCATTFGAPANTQTCPVCLGLPGALPVLNREAIRLAIITGLALNSQIPTSTKWDRKNYFYPDLPKGYQISQFDEPICQGGELAIRDAAGVVKTIRIRRAHLEEDAGKSMHDEVHGTGNSRIDLNRTGTPLLEIVSEPDLSSPQEAKSYLTELKLLLTYLGVSDCNMQEGSLRVDANVNLHLEEAGETIATPIVEIKNLNSFRAVERALEYEQQRQWDDYQETRLRIGQAPKQTRGWDDARQVTTLQREKEESSDYRYFPDPDLIPITLDSAWIEKLREQLQLLPAVLRERLKSDYGLSEYDAEVLVNQGPELVDYFEAVASQTSETKRVSNWIQQEVMRTLNETDMTIATFPVSAAQLAELIGMISDGKVDNSRAKDVFRHLLDHRSSIEEALKSLGIESVDSSEIVELCRQLLADNPQVIVDFQAGKQQAVGALIGAARKANPNANPGLVRATLIELIQQQS